MLADVSRWMWSVTNEEQVGRRKILTGKKERKQDLICFIPNPAVQRQRWALRWEEWYPGGLCFRRQSRVCRSAGPFDQRSSGGSRGRTTWSVERERDNKGHDLWPVCNIQYSQSNQKSVWSSKVDNKAWGAVKWTEGGTSRLLTYFFYLLGSLLQNIWCCDIQF